MVKFQAMTFSFVTSLISAFVLVGTASAAGTSDHVMPGTTYYAVAEAAASGDQPISRIFAQNFGPLAPTLPQGFTGNYNLMRWWHSANPPPIPPERYLRAVHFGPWMVKPTGNCLNTRALVLVRDSRVRVTAVPDQPCVVDTGLWYDPYTNQNYQRAQDLQIDHVVALKNAYISGAFQWDWKTRCSYANFMGNPFHLIAVQGAANLAKSDYTVAGYLPPNLAYRCEFLANVLRIKLIWRLWISEPEAAAITQAARDMNCDPRWFQFPSAELARQRQFIGSGRDECPATPPPPPPPRQPVPGGPETMGD